MPFSKKWYGDFDFKYNLDEIVFDMIVKHVLEKRRDFFQLLFDQYGCNVTAECEKNRFLYYDKYYSREILLLALSRFLYDDLNGIYFDSYEAKYEKKISGIMCSYMKTQNFFVYEVIPFMLAVGYIFGFFLFIFIQVLILSLYKWTAE